MKISILCYLLLFLLISTSCVLDLDDENFVKVDHIPDPSFVGDLEYFSYDQPGSRVSDTIWLEDSVSLRITGDHFVGCDVIVNEDTVLHSNTPYFSLVKGERKNGAYPLTVIQYVNSGTKSLADKLNAEFAVYSSEYVLMVVPDFIPEISGAAIQEGAVEVKWKPYLRNDFQGYELNIYGLDDWGGSLFLGKVRIDDPFITTFTDVSYVGEEVGYEIAVKRSGEVLISEKFTTEFEYDPEMKLTKIADGSFRLSWTPPPFYNNVKKITVLEDGVKILGDNILPGPTSLTINEDMIYGDRKSYSMELTSKNIENAETPRYDNNTISNVRSHFTSLTFGQEIPAFSSLAYSKSESSFFLLGRDHFYTDPRSNEYILKVYKLDEETLEVTGSVDVITYYDKLKHFVMAPDGEYLYLLYHEGEIQQLRLKDLKLGELFQINQNLESYYERVNFSVSNNNRLVLSQWDAKIRVLDFRTKNILLTVESSSASDISDDGNYFINGSNLYSYSAGTFVLSGQLPYNEIRFVSFLSDEGKVCITTNDKIILYDYTTHTEINTIEVVNYNPHNAHLDQKTRVLSSFSSEAGLQMFNVITGENLSRASNYLGGYNLEGDVLFLNYGFALKDY